MAEYLKCPDTKHVVLRFYKTGCLGRGWEQTGPDKQREKMQAVTGRRWLKREGSRVSSCSSEFSAACTVDHLRQIL